MRRSLLSLVILQLASGSCPPGFDLVRDGECRGFYGSLSIRDDQVTNTAIAKCEEIHGHVASIHNDEQQVYYTGKVNTTASKRIVLGLVCKTGATKWEWSDGTSLDYRPPVGYDNTLNAVCRSDCVWYLYYHGVWNVFCDSSVGPFENFCTTQLQQPVPADDGCDGFDDDTDDGACYQVGDTAESWQEAQMSCAKLGANLASIHSPQENSFVRRLAVTKGAVNGVYLGASMSGKGTDFEWVDGTSWNYENFHPGFPIVGLGDCLAMDTSISSGLWMNFDCSAQLPVACIRDQKTVEKPSCSSDPWKENTLITSPGFPYSASTFCDYFLMTDPGKKVEVEIIFLEANSCCDSLVIYDGYLGASVLAKITGEQRNVTFTTTSSNMMRVNWQPNGGVNVMGMAMTFRGV